MNESTAPRSESRALTRSEMAQLKGIAVDTNIYKNRGFRLDAPPLAELGRLPNVSVLLPEVWEREILKHMQVWAGARIDEVRKNERFLEIGTAAQQAAAQQILAAWADETPETMAQRMFEEHVRQTGAIRLPTSWSRGHRVLDNYFNNRPPFESAGSKKAEFPDAFALCTLEEWAQSNDWKVIVVSADQGCIDACNNSPSLIAYANLVDALSAIADADQSLQAERVAYQAALVQELATKELPLRKQIDLLIVRSLEDMPVEVHSYADRPDYDYEVDSLQFLGITRPPDQMDLSILSVEADSLMFAWWVPIKMRVAARFFRTYGKNVRTIAAPRGIPLHEGTIKEGVEVLVKVTAPGLTPSDLGNAVVQSIGLDQHTFQIDFGRVEPYEPDYEE